MAVQIKNKQPKPNPYEAHLDGTAINATTTIDKKVAGSDFKNVSSETEQLSKGMLVPAHELCHIEVGGGQTLNLGNYESARIDVRLTVPCSKNDLEAAYEFASDWVSAKITESVKAAKGLD